MRIFAIDPGPKKSAYVIADCGVVEHAQSIANHLLREVLLRLEPNECAVVIELIASYGMAVGAEVFETCIWIGRFAECAGACYGGGIYRKDVKMTLCGNVRAKDANIRQALIDRYGGKDKAIGRKSQPGPLYGISGDQWSALAVALAFTDRWQPPPIIRNDDEIPF